MRRDALVVGINQYPFLKDTPTSPAKHLTTPAADAEAIAQLLENHGDFRVKRLPESIIEGKLQVDPKKKVTTEELETAIANLFLPNSNNIPTTALLFFAGHGLRRTLDTQKQGFLAVSDTNFSREKWGMSLEDLWDILQKSQVKQQVIWLDCCFSGELLNFRDTELGRQNSGCDRCLIAASRDYEVAYQQLDSKHGLFSSALIAGIDPYKNQENEWVTNEQLTIVVRQKLQKYYREKRISQIPQISNHGEAIKLILGKPNPLDKFLQALVRQVDNKLPFSTKIREELQEIQHHWNLKNEDIELLYIRLAKELYKQNRLQESIYIFKEALVVNPNNPIIHEQLAYILLENGQIEDAIHAYEYVINLKPNNINLHVWFGTVFYRTNQLGRAIEAYKLAIKFSDNKSVDLAKIYYLLGKTFYQCDIFNDDAVRSYEEAIKIKQDYPEAMAGLAMALYKAGNYLGACETLKKAIDFQPKNPDFRRDLGIIFAGQGKYKDAIVEFKEAINQNAINSMPDPVAYTHYAFALLANNQKKKAESEIKLAVELFRKQGMNDAAEQMEYLFEQIKKESSWGNLFKRFIANT
ncbi:peptidase C14 caspase catalytic subunit p20 [Calothrix sp. PCC 6303]|nr:peptidase C14 caspase catalytic subunit p20 [Calothrix sp. PCC 6303]